MKKKQHGGPRPNSGRKPVDDKKKPVILYLRESVIDKLGIDRIREVAETAILKAS